MESAEHNKPTRNMGIDLLRITAMFMVVVLHMLLPILSRTNRRPGVFELTWLLECASYCAVNCFGLISGWVGAGRSVSVGRALGLWLQVAFYSLGFTLLGLALRSPSTENPLAWAASPIISGRYWYMTAYFGVMLFMPALEAGVRSLSEGQLGLTALGVLALSVTVTFYTPSANMSISREFNLGGGYSVIWLALLYLVGGWLRRSRLVEKVKKGQAALLYLAAFALTWGGALRDDWRWVSYVSPSVLLEGVALTVLFSKVKVRNALMGRAVGLFAPAALGVYLIHISPWLYSAYTGRLTLSYPDKGGLACAVLVLLTAAAVYVVSTVVELVRIKLFALLGVKKLTRAIDDFLKRQFGGERKDSP